jgi:hypothetical protein
VPTKAAVYASGLAALFAMTGCWKYYHAQFVCGSPDGHSEVRVVRNLPGYAADYRFKIELSSVHGRAVIHNQNRESSIGLVEAHWSSDGSKLGLLVCDMLSGPVLLGYDVGRTQEMPVDTIKPILERQLLRKYSQADRTDPISWACSNDGNAAYQKIISDQAKVRSQPLRQLR